MNKKKVIEIGYEEWVGLPELGLPAIKAKVDTGAATSSLHAFFVQKQTDKNGEEIIKFGIHPIPEMPHIEIYGKAPLVDEREITSSNGQTELRYVISTKAQFGDQAWPIEISLSNREDRHYRMLLGRSAMQGKLVVRPEGSCILGEKHPQIYEKQYEPTEDKTLRIAILSREPKSYSTTRLKEAAQKKGHQVDVLNTTKCYVDIAADNQALHYQGKQLDHYDVVIPRIGASITAYGLAILRQFESLGTFCLNGSNGIAHSRDKLLAHQLLSRARIKMPTTAFGRSPGDTKDIISIVNGAPLIIKLLQRSQGESVVLAETNKAAQAVIQAFRGLGAEFIVQEYIKESAGTDIRCLVLGNKVIGAMERRGAEGEFRSNLHQGGQGFLAKITPEERKMAVKAAKILGLKFAGVDMLRAHSGSKVIEVNSSPGLQGIEGVTQKDIAGKVIDFIEAHARPTLVRRIVG